MSTATEEKQARGVKLAATKNCGTCGGSEFLPTVLAGSSQHYLPAEYCKSCGVVRVKVQALR